MLSIVIGTEVGQNIRIIGVFGEQRLANLDVPTFKEQGYNVSPASFGGLLAPTATPQPILSKLSSACAEAAKSDLYATTAKRAGQPDEYYADAAAFRQRLARDIESKAVTQASTPMATQAIRAVAINLFIYVLARSWSSARPH